MQALYISYLLLTVVGNVIVGLAARYGWINRHRTQGAGVFALLMAVVGYTNTMFLGIGLSQTFDAAFFFGRARFLGIALIPALVLIFCLRYVGVWTSTLFHGTLCVVPLLANFLLWTNDAHGLFYKSWRFYFSNGIVIEALDYGPVYPIYLTFLYGYIAAGLGALLVAIWRAQGIHRHQYSLIALVFVVAFLFNIPSALEMIPFSYPSLNQFSVILVGLGIGISMFRIRLLDIRPIANDAVVSSMEDGVIVLHRRGYVAGFSPVAERILGCPSADILGRPLAEAFLGEPEWSTRLAAAIASPNAVDVVTGSPARTIEMRASPVRLRSGEILGHLILLRDVTETRRAQERALNLELTQARMRMVNDFIHSSSHDLRTPLTVIRTSAYLLRKTQTPANVTQHLDTIDQQVQHLARSIEQLHGIIELNQHIGLETSEVLLESIRRAVPAPLILLANRKHIAVDWQLSPRVPPIIADFSMLMMAFQNVLHNSLLYTPEGGSVVVRTYVGDTAAVIEVTDSGVGIAAEHLPHIFDEFFKVDVSRASAESGIGLGLAMVRRIMEMHGGRADCTSEPGHGSTFRLYFPLKSHNAPTVRGSVTGAG